VKVDLNRLTLMLAYLLLIFVTTWTTYRLDKDIDRNRNVSCAGSAAAVLVTATLVDESNLTPDQQEALSLALRLIAKACDIDVPVLDSPVSTTEVSQ
jgi:hypothetical protein